MNGFKLEQRLQQLGVPRNAYHLTGGLPNEAFTLNQLNGSWEVYYSERGQKTGCKVFNTEHEACVFFLSYILSDGAVRSIMEQTKR